MAKDSYRLLQLDEVDSTNSYARARLHELQHGDVIQAAVQTAGRGRNNRSWISDVPGNLYLSIVVKPRAVTSQLPALAHVLALCGCRMLTEQGLSCALKWPNDLLVNFRKIAGILPEARFEGNQMTGMVLGIGVNLNLPAAELERINQPATSLNIELGRFVDAELCRDRLLDLFFEAYPRFEQGGFEAFRTAYLERSCMLGQMVQVKSGAGTIRGRFKDVGPDGALILEMEDGILRAVSAGEMFGLAPHHDQS